MTTNKKAAEKFRGLVGEFATAARRGKIAASSSANCRLRIGLAAHGGSRIARHFHSRRQQSGTGTGADGIDALEATGHPSL
jgi:hypothetical protein